MLGYEGCFGVNLFMILVCILKPLHVKLLCNKRAALIRTLYLISTYRRRLFELPPVGK